MYFLWLQRNHVFKWFAFVSKEFDADIVSSILKTVLPALQREADEVRKGKHIRMMSCQAMWTEFFMSYKEI